MSHTKEPWFVEGGYSRDRDDKKWDQFSVCDASDAIATTTGLGNDEANARRIVACVNACAGYSTDDLEKYGRWISSGDFACEAEVYQQRDELLASLEECLAAYSASPKRPPDLVEDWEKILARIDKANRRARDIIAKVKR